MSYYNEKKVIKCLYNGNKVGQVKKAPPRVNVTLSCSFTYSQSILSYRRMLINPAYEISNARFLQTSKVISTNTWIFRGGEYWGIQYPQQTGHEDNATIVLSVPKGAIIRFNGDGSVNGVEISTSIQIKITEETTINIVI